MASTSIALDTLTATVARAIERFPREKGRIERGAALIVLGAVTFTADAATVRSQTDAGVTYTLGSDGCPCVDAQRHPGQSCKHRWAVDLVLVATERQRRLDAREHLTADELARLAEWKRDHAGVAA